MLKHIASPDLNLYRQISEIAYRHAGLVLGDDKLDLVRARVARRIHDTRVRTLDAYVALLRSADRGDELPNLISALTTNYTHFYREAEHFETLASQVLPAIAAEAPASFRIWSAGCSTGQEPISIATTLLESHYDIAIRARIWATDIDRAALGRATEGAYSDAEMRAVSEPIRDKYFHVQNNRWQMKPNLRDLITYAELNLLAPWNFADQFHCIFCRNVAIYFDAAAQERLWMNFFNKLAPRGWLFIGHSERLPEKLRMRMDQLGPTSFRKSA